MSTDWDDHAYRVIENRPVTPVIRELRLAPDGEPLRFRAGQYVLLTDHDWGVPQRSYSLADAPREDGRVSLLVTRVLGGPTSGWVHERLRAGDPVTLSGPYGTFVAEPGSGPVLLLGAGSGLAPVRALAEALLAEAAEREVTLFFSARTPADSIDHDRFLGWTRSHPGFRYLRTLTRAADAPPHPHIPELLADAVGRLDRWQVFVAGPPGFVTGCASAARGLGASATAVHTEEFFTDPQPWTGLAPAAIPPGARR